MIKSNGGIIGPDNVTTGGAFGTASGVFKLGEVTDLINESKWPTAGPQGFQVANSVRMNDGSSDYFSRTCGSTASSYTVSMWVKTSKSSGSSASGIWWNAATNKLGWELNDYGQIYYYNAGTPKTTGLYRDTSAWYHLVWKVTSNTGTLYVNGAAAAGLTGIGSIASLVSGNSLQIGADNGGGTFDGYMAEVCFIDGTALDPTSFGEFNSQTGIWVPKSVTGLTFGTNGFYLDFKDSSALGNDVSGNNNDLTANNLTSIDQSTDTCSTNFATLNPLDNYYCAGTFSDGNNTIVTGSSQYSYVRGTLGVSQGKWYYEAKAVATSSSNTWYSIGWSGNSPSGTAVPLGNQPDSVSYQGQNGTIRINTNETSTGTTFTTGDIIGTALDLDNNLVYFYKNGTLVNSSGTAITASASTTNGVWCPAVGDFDSSGTKTWSTDFGSPVYAISSGNTDQNGFGNFEYAPPAGFLSLNTKNLAAVLG